MNRSDLKELIRLANHLDNAGERKIANELDFVIKKVSLLLLGESDNNPSSAAFTIYIKRSDTEEEIKCCDIDTAKEVRQTLRTYVFGKGLKDSILFDKLHEAGEEFDTIVIVDNFGGHRTELSIPGLHTTVVGKGESRGSKDIRERRDFIEEEFARKHMERAEMPEEESLMPMPSDEEDFTGDLFFTEAARTNKRISKTASLLSRKFGRSDGKVRR